MEIVVDDTNILIDLVNTELLARCKELKLTFVTTDFVIRELHDKFQKENVQRFIDEGGLTVHDIKNSDLIDVVVTYQHLSASTNLSPADVSVMLLAEKLNCRLLSNDQKLINHARQRGITANGLLWLTDLMTDQNIVSSLEMIDYLQTLLSTNERAPRALIMDRIQKYTLKIK